MPRTSNSRCVKYKLDSVWVHRNGSFLLRIADARPSSRNDEFQVYLSQRKIPADLCHPFWAGVNATAPRSVLDTEYVSLAEYTAWDTARRRVEHPVPLSSESVSQGDNT